MPWYYCERLGSISKEILKDGAAKKKLHHLQDLLPDNPLLIATELKMKFQLDKLEMTEIHEQLSIDYSNFYLWLLKVKLFKKTGDFVSAIQCTEVVLDMLEDETEEIHEKLFFRHKFMKTYNKLKESGVKYASLTAKEALMLFIYHPASVAYARKFRESIKEFKVGLDLIENTGGKHHGAHIYPIEECVAKMQKMKEFSAVPSSDDLFIKNIMRREGFYLPTHFYRVKEPST